MGRPLVGAIVTVIFPFSDLKGSKVRPALIVAPAEFENVILCQITSKPYSSRTAIRLSKSDMAAGQLPITSYIRPDKLFTADLSIIDRTIGHLKPAKRNEVLTGLRELFRASEPDESFPPVQPD